MLASAIPSYQAGGVCGSQACHGAYLAEILMTAQALRDTAVTRMRESECLLNECQQRRIGRDRRDGAVTCALLAVECALKVLVMRRHGVTRVNQLDEALQKKLFAGKLGHDLAVLSQHLDAVTAPYEPAVKIAICTLHSQNRYDLRYGAKRPRQLDATPLVTHARAIIDWMEGLTQ